MTFLELCQRAAVECGVASTQDITIALPTTIGTTGSLGRIVNWINDAWTDLQMEHEWDWMRSSALLGAGISFTTVAGQAVYPVGTGPGTVGVAADSFGSWARETFRCYPTAYGFGAESFLTDIPFDAWRDTYMLGAQRTVQTRPDAIAVGPNQTLCLGPPPNALYTVTGDYFVAASEMALDTDVPTGLPVRFHMLIVYRTMMKYGGYESAPEVYQRGSEENNGMYRQLELLQLPITTWGGALA